MTTGGSDVADTRQVGGPSRTESVGLPRWPNSIVAIRCPPSWWYSQPGLLLGAGVVGSGSGSDALYPDRNVLRGSPGLAGCRKRSA